MSRKVGRIQISMTVTLAKDADSDVFLRSTDALVENLREYVAFWVQRAIRTSPEASPEGKLVIDIDTAVELLGRLRSAGSC